MPIPNNQLYSLATSNSVSYVVCNVTNKFLIEVLTSISVTKARANSLVQGVAVFSRGYTEKIR